MSASFDFTPTISVTLPPTQTPETYSELVESSRISYLSTTATSIIACLSLMIALMYLVVLSWAYKIAAQHPKPLNKNSGVKLQKMAPIGYVSLVLSSLVAISSWLILQYRFNHNYPSVETRTGVRILLFAASWTCLTASLYTLLFLHPKWSKHPISSIGAQLVWLFATLIFWITGTVIINTSIPEAIGKGNCAGVVYCAQLRAFFGIAVMESLILSGSIATMLWVVWQSNRYVLEPPPYPLSPLR